MRNFKTIIKNNYSLLIFPLLLLVWDLVQLSTYKSEGDFGYGALILFFILIVAVLAIILCIIFIFIRERKERERLLWWRGLLYPLLSIIAGTALVVVLTMLIGSFIH